jgi:hypothetical protein
MERGEGRVSYRIGGVTVAFMLALALVLDLVQILLTLTGVGALLAWLVTAVGTTAFGIWFLLMRVNYFSGRKAAQKMAATLAGVVAEFVPVINALPAMTISVIAVVLLSRAEDRERLKERLPK